LLHNNFSADEAPPFFSSFLFATPHTPLPPPFTTTPGLPKSEVVRLLDHYAQKDKTKWNSGKVSGAVYHGGQELTDVASEAYKRFSLTNPLHPDIFPLLRKMESETVAMCVQAFQGGPGACGTMTSGGTESILMAVKSYRDKARKERGVVYPELVAPVTAHAAFDKACAYFCIKLVHVPVDPVTFRAVPSAMAAACTPNTIALVCSAPSYPQGVVDPIPEVAAFALKRGLPLHVVSSPLLFLFGVCIFALLLYLNPCVCVRARCF
jgi:sphinganine-1-phosphate aldolase